MTTETDDAMEAAEEAIWNTALMLGFNQLMGSAKNIGERIYYAMMRDKCKACAVAGGAKFDDVPGDSEGRTKIQLQRISIDLTRDDLPVLRAAIAELEAQ